LELPTLSGSNGSLTRARLSGGFAFLALLSFYSLFSQDSTAAVVVVAESAAAKRNKSSPSTMKLKLKINWQTAIATSLQYNMQTARWMSKMRLK
jgi:hypothetical protein